MAGSLLAQLALLVACGRPPTDTPPSSSVVSVESPAPTVLPASARDPAAGLPTPDFSSLFQPGTDLVPVLMRASRSPNDKPAFPPWLDAVAAIQVARTAALEVRQDFRFTDALEQSGITFRHRVVPDAAAAYKKNHYDHANGVSVADVDGDGLLDVHFMSQFGRKELWRNNGDGTFEDITESSGVDFEEKVGVASSFADLDNDGDPDLYITSVRHGNELFANDGLGRFTNVTESSGLGYTGHSSAADIFDYDNDGLLDLFLSNVGIYTTDTVVMGPGDAVHPGEGRSYPYYVGTEDAFLSHVNPSRSETSRMYRNEGGLRFVDVTDDLGLSSEAWNGDALPFDANRDGWVDLLLLNMQGNDVYFENQGGERFVDRSMAVFPNTPWGSMGGTVLDSDNDGRQDVYVVDMHSDMFKDVSPALDEEKALAIPAESVTMSGGRSIWGNALLRDPEGTPFVDVSDEVGVETMWPWGVSAADLNADGYEDLFVTSSMNFGYRYHPNAVLLNVAGQRFARAEFVLGIEPRRDRRAFKPWFSVDCAASPEHPLCSGTGQSGPLYVTEPYGSRGSVAFDIENDGDLDVITLDLASEPQVLLSDLTAHASVNYLVVKLTGTTANRDGLGAVVSVTVGDSSFQQVHDGQSGYLAQSSMPLYFGLGAHDAAESVTVTWPGGQHQTIAGPIASGTFLDVTEGE